MDSTELLQEMQHEVTARRRGFAPGLLMAFVDFLKDLGLPRDDIETFDDFIAIFPRQEETRGGTRANQLIVRTEESTEGIRPRYNRVLELIRKTHHRFDYPKSAPHSTQAWVDYVEWLDALCSMNASELDAVWEGALSYVLDTLPDQGFDPSSIEVPTPDFLRLLEDFDFTAPAGEPSGAAFQGAVFGFIRADNPHLQVEIRRVRTGSKREQRVGDIDAWDGERLALTAEVKNFGVGVEVVETLEEFIHESNRRNAIGVVVAQSFSEEARVLLEESGLRTLNLDDLEDIVQLWDPAKQRIAVESFRYYAVHVEQKSVLVDRIREFYQLEVPEVGPDL